MSNEEAKKQNLKKRFVTGVITGATILSAFYVGGYVLAAVVAVFVFFALKEYVQIIQHKGFQPSLRIIALMTFILFIMSLAHMEEFLPIALFFGVTLSCCAVLFKLRQPYIANVATTVFGFLLCWFPTYIYLIRCLGSSGKGFLTLCEPSVGLSFISLTFFTILFTDVGAYYFGSKYGKHKLSDVSPKKTVEGAVGGSLAAIITSVIIGYFININIIDSFIAGCLITFFAQIGDLSESLIKRDAGVKDSGDSLPGHGGFLDRADSYILSAPVAYFYFKFIVLGNVTLIGCFQYIQKALSNVGIM